MEPKNCLKVTRSFLGTLILLRLEPELLFGPHEMNTHSAVCDLDLLLGNESLPEEIPGGHTEHVLGTFL